MILDDFVHVWSGFDLSINGGIFADVSRTFRLNIERYLPQTFCSLCCNLSGSCMPLRIKFSAWRLICRHRLYEEVESCSGRFASLPIGCCAPFRWDLCPSRRCAPCTGRGRSASLPLGCCASLNWELCPFAAGMLCILEVGSVSLSTLCAVQRARTLHVSAAEMLRILKVGSVSLSTLCVPAAGMLCILAVETEVFSLVYHEPLV